MNTRLGGPQTRSGPFGDKKNPLSLPRFKCRIFQSVETTTVEQENSTQLITQARDWTHIHFVHISTNKNVYVILPMSFLIFKRKCYGSTSK
jgi:hypothetical protein